MRILFAALHNGYYRNLDSVVEELARRGHEIRLGAEREDSSFGGQPIVDRLTAAYRNVSSVRTAVRDQESLFLASKVRFAIDYLRYLEAGLCADIRCACACSRAHPDRNAAAVNVVGARLASDETSRQRFP